MRPGPPASVAPAPAGTTGVDAALAAFLAERRQELGAEAPELLPLAEEVAAIVAAGGKRIRPAFLDWGYRAGGGAPDERTARAGAALEMLHTFALIQDDLIDESAVRRGRPTAHVGLADLFEGEPAGRAAFGRAAALLASDLAFLWADDLLLGAGFDHDPLRAGYAVFTRMRREMTLGEFLDLAAASTEPVRAEEAALRAYRFKTAAYTVARPIQLGIALAGGGADLQASVDAYALPAGVAFQLRDDLIGAFGDPVLTGKASDDLSRGKPTWLLARALGRAGREGAAAILTTVAGGDASERGAERLREMVLATGAPADAETLIEELAAEALAGARRMPVSDASLVGELVDLTERLVRRIA